MGKLIGIDLGTTNSVVAIADGPVPRVLDNKEARPQTRSVVGLKKRRGKAGDAAEMLVGDAAMDNFAMAPKDTIISIKRLMGRGVGDTEVQKVRQWALYDIVEPADGTRDGVRVLLGGKELSPVDVSALILRKLKDDAEFRLGDRVTHAVITVPAYFTQTQRDATRKAGLKAGLKVIKILEEPTAAAIAFGIESGDDTPKTVLVFDLGGGTFDISVLMWAGNVFAPLNLEGDMWLGGDTLDERVVEYAVRHVQDEFGIDPTGNLRFMAELKKACQAIKERLSSAHSADLIVTGSLQDAAGNLIDLEMEITREQFERLILPLVGCYRDCVCGQVNDAKAAACAVCGASLRASAVREGRTVQIVRKALEHPAVNMTPDQIDYVIMAGNSTNLPIVQRTMEEMFGPSKVLRKVHPKHSVAIGAAMVAAWHGAQTICHAPDPADPHRECGHVNGDDATACAKCGAPLALVDAPTGPEMTPSRIGAIGAIAPMDYGIQTRGDRFNVFVRKGDPIPTTDPQMQAFFTHTPKQRMISLPVYGGENESASANEKQGEFFAVLPPNLPERTAVRIKLSLDADGVFLLTAHLDDGTDLHPWIVKGETDARAVEELQQAEKLVAQAGAEIPPQGVQSVEQARRRAFEKLRAHDFDGARQEVAAIEQAVRELPTRLARSSVKAQAEDLLSWVDFVLQQYAWAFELSDANRINGLAKSTREALASGDTRRLEAAYTALDKGTVQLPEIVDVLLRFRGAISRVRGHDPARGAALLRRLEGIESSFRLRRPQAEAELQQLADEVGAALQQHAGAGMVKCSKGHDVPRGERYCPACREDTWGLEGGSTQHAGGVFQRT